MSDDERFEIVEVEYDRIIRETDSAGLFAIDGGEFWLPWSQVEDHLSLEADGGTVCMPRWLAEKNGFD